MAETSLDIIISATDRASSELGKVGKSAGMLNTALTGVATGGLAAVAGGVMAVGKAAIDASLEFDEASDNIMTQTGATGAELEGLQDTILNLSGTLPALGASWDDVGAAVGATNVHLGLTGEQLETVSADMLTFARLTGGDATTAAEDVARVLDGFNESAAKAPGLLDAVFTAQQDFGVNAQEMLSTLDANAAIFQTWQLELPAAIGLLGQLQAGGVESDKAIAGLRTAATKLAEDGIPPTREALSELFTDIKELGSVDGVAGLNMAIEHFGTKAGPEMYQAIMDGKVTLDTLNTDLDTTATNLNEVATAAKDAEDDYDLAMDGMKESMIPLGDSLRELAAELIPGVQAAVTDVLIPAFNEATKVIQGIKDLASGERTLSEIQADSYADVIEQGGGSSYTLPPLGEDVPAAARDAYNRAMNGAPTIVNNIYGDVRDPDMLNQVLRGQGVR